MYRFEGKTAIHDTYPRKGYLTKDKRAKAIVDQALVEESQRLKVEIEYLKKIALLNKKMQYNEKATFMVGDFMERNGFWSMVCDIICI